MPPPPILDVPSLMRLALTTIILLSAGACGCHRATGASHQTETPPADPSLHAPPPQPGQVARAEPFTQRIPGTIVEFQMIPVGEIYFARTEVTWDEYDVFVYGLDVQGEALGEGARTAEGAVPAADAVTRPSKPYVPPDRGYGHTGYPALSATYAGAKRYCEWLSAKTGKTYRLPTEAEWISAAGQLPTDAPSIDALAWHTGNAGFSTHRCASLAANAAGLHDMLGNVAEWVTGDDAKPVALGGSFRQTAEQIAAGVRLKQDATWNMSDPQIPKSAWWLADADFIGFRVVCENSNNAPPATEPGAQVKSTEQHRQ